jgi:hypothetical protein
MKRTTHLLKAVKALLFVLALQSCPSVMSEAKPASGRFTPHCQGAFFFLAKVDGLGSEQKLNLYFPPRGLNLVWGMAQEHWEDVAAEQCTTSGKCEQATQAKIWLNKSDPYDKHVSGKYDVTFKGQHLEGTFRVKFLKEKGAWICE